MAEDVNASIGIDIDTSKAIAAIRQLSAEISAFHQLHSKKGAAVAQDLAAQTQNLTHLINRTGSYRASMTTVASATESFTTALEKNKLAMGDTMRYAMGSMKPFSRIFKSEWEMVSKVARERVKDLQTQYIRLGRDATGAVQAIKIRPLTLDMENLQTKTMLAAQRMQVLNKLVEHGSTQLLNWGKNTQWAGRQLMVGFTIPLTMLGAASAKTFMDMEKQIIKIQRVYGDFSTTVEETTKMTDSLKELSLEFTKWGVSVTDTLNLAADAAATGAMGADLINQVTNATKLAVLGNVSQQEALETTMSVTNAFGIATEDLANKINFLNAVENQSVTSIQDLTTAIPIAAPVVKQLGGTVEDLAFFMTAMKEGGIDAGEGANALKSGLASIINPTEKASEMLMSYGINLKGIVESNKGDVKSIVIEFAQALDQLDPLNRAQAIEQLFGKFQFSRISTLFQNVIKEGTQAQRVLELSQSSTEQLAVLSQRELAKVEESTTYKFEAAMQRFQASLAPVGEEFLKAVTPLLDFGSQLLEQFNKWDDGAKTFAVTFAAVIGGIGPVLLMAIGLVANGVANLIKLFQFIGKTMFGVGKSTDTLGMQTDYMTQNMIEASAAASSLGQTHSNLTQVYTSEAAALRNLAGALEVAAASQRKMQATAPVIGRTKPPKGFASGTMSVPKYASGVMSVPGPKGKGDVVPAMLSPGEAIIPADMAKKYAPLIQGIISENIPGYQEGRFSVKFPQASVLEASHMAPELVNMTVAEMQKVMRQELEALIESGAISREMANFGAIENLQPGQKVMSGLTPLLPGDINQAYTASKAGGLSPQQIMTSLQRSGAPIGAMLGSGVQSNDVWRSLQGLGDAVSDKNMSKYFNDLGNIFEEELALLGDKQLTEAELQDVYLKANEKAIAKQDKKTQQRLRQATQLGTARTQIANPGGATGSGRTPRGSTVIGARGQRFNAQKVSRANRRNVERIVGPLPFLDQTSKLFRGTQQEEQQVRSLKIFERLSELEKKSPEEARKLANKMTKAIESGSIQGIVEASKEIDVALGRPAKDAGKKVVKKATESVVTGVTEQASKQSGARLRRISQSEAYGSMTPAQKTQYTKAKKAGDEKRARILLQESKDKIRNEEALIIQQQQEEEQAKRDERNRIRRERYAAKKAAETQAQRPRTIGSRISDAARNAGGRIKGFVTSGRGAGVGMAASMGLMMASGMGGPVGDVAGAVAGPMMALSMLGPLIGSLPAPVTAAVVAIGALAAVGISAKMAFDNAQRAAENFAQTTGASAKSIKALAEASGKVSAGEIMDKRRETSMQFARTEETNAISQQYLASEAGQASLKALGENLSSGGSQAAIRNIVSQMTTAIASGAISAVDAKAIVEDIGKQLGDTTFALRANAQITALVGPNGEDLTKDPIGVRLKILEGTEKQITKLGTDVEGFATDIGQMFTKPIEGALKGDWASIGQNALMATLPTVGLIVGGIQQVTELGTQTGAFAANMVIANQQSQEMLDSLQLEYETRIANATAAGDVAEAERLATEYAQGRKDLLTQSAETMKVASDAYAQMESNAQTGVIGSLDQQIKDLYAEGPLKAIAEQTISQIGALTPDGGQTEFVLKTVVAAGDVDPDTMNSVLSLLGEEQVDVAANIVTTFGGAEADRLFQLTKLLESPETAKNLMIGMQGMDPEEVTQTLNMFEEFGKISGQGGVDAIVNIAVNDNGTVDLDKLEEIRKEIHGLDAEFAAGPVSADRVAEYITNYVSKGFKMTQEQIDYYNSLPPDQQKKYVAAFITVLETINANTAAGKDRLREWAQDKGTLQSYRKVTIRNGEVAGVTYDYERMQQDMTSEQAGAATTTPTIPSFPESPFDGGGGGGGGAATPPKSAEEIQLENLNNQLSKQQKALNILSFQEDDINKKYEKRKEALKEIADINAQIAEEQRSQLELANALASGDIAAAARAAQDMRAKAAEQAIKDQEKALEEAQKRELASVTFEGKTREQWESQIKALEKQIAELEYRMPQKAKGGLITGPGTATSDSIPTMLSNGEFVVRASSVAKVGLPFMEAINNGEMPELRGAKIAIPGIKYNAKGPAFNKGEPSQEGSGSVYNYSIVVNAETNANPDQIANAVMSKIKQVEGQRVRGVIR